MIKIVDENSACYCPKCSCRYRDAFNNYPLCPECGNPITHNPTFVTYRIVICNLLYDVKVTNGICFKCLRRYNKKMVSRFKLICKCGFEFDWLPVYIHEAEETDSDR